MSLKKIGVILWLSVCLNGSIVYSLIFTEKFNSSKIFTNLTILETLFIIFVLLMLSVIFSFPLLLYINLRKKMRSNFKSMLFEHNLIFNLYCILLYFVFSQLMVSFVEGIQLMLTYFITGLIALNIYLRKVNTRYNNGY